MELAPISGYARYSLVYLKIPQPMLGRSFRGMEQARSYSVSYGQSRSPEVKTFSEDNKRQRIITSMSWNILESSRKYGDLL